MDAKDPSRQMLRHTVATLAYRAGKALRGAPETFAQFSSGEKGRTPVRLVAHMGDLFDWALSIAKGEKVWLDSTHLPWPQEVERFFACLGNTGFGLGPLPNWVRRLHRVTLWVAAKMLLYIAYRLGGRIQTA